MQNLNTPHTSIELTGGKNIALLATGGTIAGLISQGQGGGSYKAAALPAQALLDSLPSSFAAHPAHIQTEQVAQVDSKDMSAEIWDALAARCLHYLKDEATDAIVITHGTDTLEETAWFLHCILPPSDKPVILVGAMRAADAMDADGPQNLADGIAVAQSQHVKGVLVVHAQKVHHARYVQKIHPWKIEAFASVDGPLYGEIKGHKLHSYAQNHRLEDAKSGAFFHPYWQRQPHTPWPRVAILSSYAGVCDDLIATLVAAHYKGLILQTTGNGSIHQSLLAALKAAEKAGLHIRLTTRCAYGHINAPAQSLNFMATDLPTYKARIELALRLMT